MSVFEILTIVCIALGELFVLISLVGVFRFDYVLNRMHATTIADTMGTLMILLGVILHFGLSWVSAKLVLVLIFQWLTAPVSGHLVARMVYYSREQSVEKHAEITFPFEKEGKD